MQRAAERTLVRAVEATISLPDGAEVLGPTRIDVG
jgi:hypothetical protein